MHVHRNMLIYSYRFFVVFEQMFRLNNTQHNIIYECKLKSSKFKWITEQYSFRAVFVYYVCVSPFLDIYRIFNVRVYISVEKKHIHILIRILFIPCRYIEVERSQKPHSTIVMTKKNRWGEVHCTHTRRIV